MSTPILLRTTAAADSPERVEIAQIIKRETSCQHWPCREEEQVHFFKWRKVLSERRESGKSMQQKNGAVCEALREAEHESDEQNQLRCAEHENDRTPDAAQPIKVIENRSGMLGSDEFVDCPHEHDKKDADS